MTKRILVPLVFLFASPVFSASKSASKIEGPILISYEQFSNLTHAEQKTYVKKLREMMLAIEERNPKMAADLLRNSPLLRQIASLSFPTAEAQSKSAKSGERADGLSKEDGENFDAADEYWDEANKLRTALAQTTSQKTISDSDKANLAARYRDSLAWLGSSAVHANQIKDKANKDLYLSYVRDELKEIEKLEPIVLKNLPASEKDKAKSEFTEVRDKFVKPSLEGSLDPNTKITFAKDLVRFDQRKIDEAKRAASKPATTSTAAPAATAAAAPAAPAATAPAKAPPAAAAPATKAGMESGSAKSSTPAIKEITPAAAAEAKTKAATTAQAASAAAPGAKPAAASAAAKTSSTDKTPAADKKADDDADSELYRCMHSGFVVRGEKCIPPATLQFKLTNINPDTFTCPKGSVMCNPLVFGVKLVNCDKKKTYSECWKDAKPICNVPSLTSTASCHEQSNSDEALEIAVELISANREAYQAFARDAKNLCDKGSIDYDSYLPSRRSAQSRKRVKQDIDATCTIARNHMEEVYKRFNLKYPQSGLKTGSSAASPAAKATAPAAKAGGQK